MQRHVVRALEQVVEFRLLHAEALSLLIGDVRVMQQYVHRPGLQQADKLSTHLAGGHYAHGAAAEETTVPPHVRRFPLPGPLEVPVEVGPSAHSHQQHAHRGFGDIVGDGGVRAEEHDASWGQVLVDNLARDEPLDGTRGVGDDAEFVRRPKDRACQWRSAPTGNDRTVTRDTLSDLLRGEIAAARVDGNIELIQERLVVCGVKHSVRMALSLHVPDLRLGVTSAWT